MTNVPVAAATARSRVEARAEARYPGRLLRLSAGCAHQMASAEMTRPTIRPTVERDTLLAALGELDEIEQLVEERAHPAPGLHRVGEHLDQLLPHLERAGEGAAAGVAELLDVDHRIGGDRCRRGSRR